MKLWYRDVSSPTQNSVSWNVRAILVSPQWEIEIRVPSFVSWSIVRNRRFPCLVYVLCVYIETLFFLYQQLHIINRYQHHNKFWNDNETSDQDRVCSEAWNLWEHPYPFACRKKWAGFNLNFRLPWILTRDPRVPHFGLVFKQVVAPVLFLLWDMSEPSSPVRSQWEKYHARNHSHLLIRFNSIVRVLWTVIFSYSDFTAQSHVYFWKRSWLMRGWDWEANDQIGQST